MQFVSPSLHDIRFFIHGCINAFSTKIQLLVDFKCITTACSDWSVTSNVAMTTNWHCYFWLVTPVWLPMLLVIIGYCISHLFVRTRHSREQICVLYRLIKKHNQWVRFYTHPFWRKGTGFPIWDFLHSHNIDIKTSNIATQW